MAALSSAESPPPVFNGDAAERESGRERGLDGLAAGLDSSSPSGIPGGPQDEEVRSAAAQAPSGTAEPLNRPADAPADGQGRRMRPAGRPGQRRPAAQPRRLPSSALRQRTLSPACLCRACSLWFAGSLQLQPGVTRAHTLAAVDTTKTRSLGALYRDVRAQV